MLLGSRLDTEKTCFLGLFYLTDFVGEILRGWAKRSRHRIKNINLFLFSLYQSWPIDSLVTVFFTTIFFYGPMNASNICTWFPFLISLRVASQKRDDSMFDFFKNNWEWKTTQVMFFQNRHQSFLFTIGTTYVWRPSREVAQGSHVCIYFCVTVLKEMK